MRAVFYLLLFAGLWWATSTRVWYMSYEGAPHQTLPLYERLPVSMGLDGSNIACQFMAARPANVALGAICEPVTLLDHSLAESRAAVARWWPR